MITPALKEFALDFGSRLAAHDWWTDAVFLEGARPLDVPGRRELTPRVYLRGPLDEGPPFQALTRQPVGEHLWVQLLLYDLISPTLHTDLVATGPPLRTERTPNLTLVRFRRRDDGQLPGRYGIVYHPAMDEPRFWTLP